MEIDQQHQPDKTDRQQSMFPPPPPPQLNRSLKRLLTITNCLLLCLGNASGPLLLRIYFLHGGKRQWLSAWLETAGWPLLLLPLSLSFFYRRRCDPSARTVLITPRLIIASAFIGLLTGADDYLYAYGLDFLPVSTSSVLIATQLAFTAVFAYFIVRQRFTPFSINAVALLTVGAAVLAMHASSDRPAGVSVSGYWKGFALTLGAAALYGFVLPMVELTYAKARQPVTYTLVMEMQLVIGFFATAFATVGMIINKDFQALSREAANFGLGETKYYLVLIFAAILWQCFFLGAVGVISCVNTLLAGILIAVFIPVVEVLAVIFLHENFSVEKGMALVLCLWGLASYSYGEYREAKEKKERAVSHQVQTSTV
ncbi:purine permease 3-like [Phalaenopsis equestris]|uniref:purine permease 3-like n=2 Tax=Phalaenopsis equestris TaxID=78828 RepID=UPI0009E315AF|nr:purine permease 3-like [Phalaenopsis equestris]XP_020585125.1 purine permease 3-like [Phalaenopsis equestris]